MNQLASRPSFFLATIFACTLIGACDSDPASDDGGTAADETGTASDEITDEAVQALLDDLPNGFTKINAEQMPAAQHTLSATVDVYVQNAWASEYAKIDPDASGSVTSFDVGATVIKEQFDDMGVRNGLTVMVKAPAGFNPDVGDWWWGFADADGVLTSSGALDACTGCHLARPNDNWIFGVPLDNRQ